MGAATAARVAVVICGLLGACGGSNTATQPAADSAVDEAYMRFAQHLDGCTEATARDPRLATIGENELAPGERQWRSCAYDGLRSIMMPISAYPELYAQLIAEDQAMTDGIAAGTVTRSARQARLDALRSEIASREITSPEQRTEHQKMQQVINGLR